jgi:enoyl-CoA hydratase
VIGGARGRCGGVSWKTKGEGGLDSSRYETLKFTRVGRVLTIAINLPERKNVVTHELHEEMGRAFFDAADDPDSDVVILTGVGDVFCAGGDLQWLHRELQQGIAPFVVEVKTMKRIVQGLLDCPKPVIARVNGDAMGFGATIALLCDVVIAVETARFADPHVKLGLSAGDGGALIWPQLIGYAKAKHYLLTGEPIGAAEAEKLGLITFAVAAEEFEGYAEKYAERLARGAQTAIRYTKTTANLPLRQLFTTAFEASAAYEGLCKHTADYREGVTAFVERRRPDYKGV